MKRIFPIVPFLLSIVNCYAQKSTTEYSSAQRIAIQQFIAGHEEYSFIPETWFDASTLKAVRFEWGFGAKYKPYYQVGDFNKDGIKDFAVILINQNSSAQSCAAVVFNGILGSKYRLAHLEIEPWQEALGLTLQNKQLNILTFETDNAGCFIPAGKGYIVEPCN